MVSGEFGCDPNIAEPIYVEGDKSALRPSGLRLGTPALTSRGLLEKEFQKLALFIHQGKGVGLEVCHIILCVRSLWTVETQTLKDISVSKLSAGDRRQQKLLSKPSGLRHL